jgi:hypothetical protein
MVGWILIYFGGTVVDRCCVWDVGLIPRSNNEDFVCSGKIWLIESSVWHGVVDFVNTFNINNCEVANKLVVVFIPPMNA